jgi:4'-phosphopantetheinyl transferase
MTGRHDAAPVVYVWLIRPDLGAADTERMAAMLDDAERQRAALMPEAARREFTIVHGAVRTILGEHLGAPPEKIELVRGEHGKPALAGALAATHFSLSGSNGLAMLAVTGGDSVGVDLQSAPSRHAAVRIAARFFPPAEAEFVAAGGARDAARRFTGLWARKEACVKAHGGRLAQGMGLPVRGSGQIEVRGAGSALPGPFLVRDVRAPGGYRAAVALEGARPYRVVRRSWPAPENNVLMTRR